MSEMDLAMLIFAAIIVFGLMWSRYQIRMIEHDEVDREIAEHKHHIDRMDAARARWRETGDEADFLAWGNAITDSVFADLDKGFHQFRNK